VYRLGQCVQPTAPPVCSQVVAGTNTGKSPQLAGYYAYWERAIFNALNAMVSNAMTGLQKMIDSRSKRVQVRAGRQVGVVPLHKGEGGAVPQIVDSVDAGRRSLFLRIARRERQGQACQPLVHCKQHEQRVRVRVCMQLCVHVCVCMNEHAHALTNKA